MFVVLGIPLIAIFFIGLCITGCYRSHKKAERVGRARRAAMAMETHQRTQGGVESLSGETITN
jgi:hypothetical protein